MRLYTNLRRRIARAAGVIALLTGAAITAACSGGSDAPTQPQPLAGTYALTSYGGKSLPATIFSDTGYALDMMSASLEIQSTGHYTSTFTSRETVDGNASTYVDHFSGTWTQTTPTSPSLTFKDDQDSTLTAVTWTSSEGRISFVDTQATPPVTYVFTRQP